ncbi:MAG: thioredoxin family protein [Actinomycetota bacterium]|nr:thioredoxin family protein [Actinomycetota bacterium]
MRRKLRSGALLVAVALVAAACSDDGGSATSDDTSAPTGAASFEQPFTDAEAYPVFASSEIVKGDNRLLIGLLSDEDAPIASPDISMHVAFYDLAESAERPEFETDAEFVDTGPRGLYVTYPTFDSTGKWGAEVSVSGDGLDETVRASFDVASKPKTPAIGERVPPSRTPTIDDHKLAAITTDENPDPRFYESSIHEAIAAGKPFVVTFATPKFCSSAVCAPTLDIVKKESKDWPRVEFIHVEVYENIDDPDDLEPAPAVLEWELPSEPWVFVVDGAGKVAAKFEGTVTAAELDDVLSDLD